MRMRLTDTEFRNVLASFTSRVNFGSYKKMPYDTYRNLKKIQKGNVDIYYDSYTDLNGETINRIVVSPDGPIGYEFDHEDNSFGNFLYELLKEKNQMPTEKKQYDIFGNEISCDASKIDDLASKTYQEYLVSKLTSDECGTIGSTNVGETTIYAGDFYSGNANATCAVSSGSDKQYADKLLVQEHEERLQNIDDELDVMNHLIEECRARAQGALDNKADIELTWRLQDDVDDIAKAIKDMMSEFDEYKYLVDEMNKKIALYESTQGTSSQCYPTTGFKIDVAAGCDRKEKENMDTNKMFNFDFGPVASHIRMSPYGLAMKNADGKYVSYDKATGNIMDVEIFNFDAQKFLYKMPVPVNQVAVGDIVVHMRKAMFVRAVKDGVVSVIDIYNAEAKDILPVKSPFGFNFITKVVSLIDMTGADANSPFGNMLPLLMLGEGQDIKDVLPLMMLTGNNAFGNMAQNPLMLYALMGNGDIDPVLMFAMANAFNQAPATTVVHNCGCHNHDNNGTSAT